MKNKIMVLTLGCHKNLVDSENIVGAVEKNGFDSTENFDEADTVIINTCGFIKPAKEESLNLIMQACDLKRQGKLSRVIVSGCLSERYLKELTPQLKDVDFITGVNSTEKILKYLNPDLKYELAGERKLLTPSHYAFLKISEGCNHNCSFCAIPLIRGKHISRDMNEIIDEAKGLVANGVQEINLIAQDSTYYGVDIHSKSQLPELLKRLSDIKDLQWLRLLYAYPLNFPYEILDVMNERENITKYIDMPLQHASSKLLKSMKRKMNNQQTSELIDRIRTTVNDVAIRTTFITGYPGETDEDFNELHEFIKEKQFDRVGVFTYSHEEDTKAFELKDNVPETTKQKRRNTLMEAQLEISLQKNQEKIGKTFKVLIDGQLENGDYIGRTQFDAPEVDNAVIITSKNPLEIGTFRNIKINKAEAYDLFGES